MYWTHVALATCFTCMAFVALLLTVAYTVGFFGPLPPWMLSALVMLSTGSVLLEASQESLSKARKGLRP